MEENIAGYKKDNKDYSKYKAEHYKNKVAFKAGGNSTYFDTGHIKDVEEMDFDDVSSDLSNGIKNSVFEKSEIQINDENELTKLDNICNQLTPEYIEQYNFALQRAQDYAKSFPSSPVPDGNIKWYRDVLDEEVKRLTNGEFSSYEFLIEYRDKILQEYNKKIKNHAFLPDFSETESMQNILSEYNITSFYLSSYENGFNEMKKYYDQIPSYLVGSYNQAKYQSQPNYVGYGPSMQAARGNVEIFKKQLDDKVYEVTNGKYNSYETFIKDYNYIKNGYSSYKMSISQIEETMKTHVYHVMAEDLNYQNYNSKYDVKVVVNDWVSDNDRMHHEVVYTFYDENGNVIPKSSDEYDKLLRLYKASEIKNDEEYLNEVFKNLDKNTDGNLYENLDIDFDYYKMYLFLQDKYGDDVANQYLDDMSDEINCVTGMIEAVDFCKGLLDSDNVLEDIANTLPVHFKGIGDGTINSIEGLVAWFQENPEKTSNYYEAMWIANILSTGKYGKIQGFNYETGQSVGNMLPSVALSAVNPLLGKMYLGLSSGGNKYRQLRWQGEDLGKARILGLLSGGSEVLTESLLGGLPGLSEVKVTNLKTWLIASIREGNQEVLQDLINSALLGEEFTLEDAVKTWLIAAITSGEMNIPGLALGKISRSNITEKNSLLKIETENGTIEIDTNEIAKYIKEHPDAKLEDVIKNFIGSNVESIDETISRFEANSEIEVQNIKDEILSGMPQGVDDLTKIRYLYLELNKRLSFDPAYNATPNGNPGAVESLRGNFNFKNMINRFVVCKGWSQLFSELVVSAGIDSSRVSIAGKGHYWVEIDFGDKILRADATDPQLSYHGIDLNASKYGENTNGFMLIDKSLSGVRIGVFDNIRAGIRGLVDEVRTYNNNYTWLRSIDESLGYTKDGKYYSERVKELERIFSDPSALETLFGGVTGEELTRAKINYLFEMDFGSTMSSEDARAYANQLLYTLLDDNERGLVSVSRMYYASEGYNNYAGIFSIEIQNSDGSITARIISDNKDSTAGSSGTKCITKVFNNHEEYLDYLSSVGVGDSMLYSDDYY